MTCEQTPDGYYRLRGVQFSTRTSHAHGDGDDADGSDALSATAADEMDGTAVDALDATVGGRKHVRDSRSKSAKRFKSHLPKRNATARTLLRTVMPGGSTL